MSFTHAVPADDRTPLAFGGNVLGVGKAVAYVPGVSENAEGEFPVLIADHKVRVTRVTWIPSAAVTGHDDNNATVKLVNVQDNPGTDDVDITAGKEYVAGTDSAANQAEVLPLHATEDNHVLETDDVVVFDIDGTKGTGLAVPEGVVVVDYVSA